jgi:formate/nitrite transporter FocA (FNT family)
MSEERPDLSQAEEREVEERSPPRARVVHAAVIKQGEDELERPLRSLFWSGIAAGVAIMASLYAQGGLHHKLPDAPWREAVVDLGYTLGFLLVILGRMQLFTEHTSVAVLPLFKAPSLDKLGQVARLWSVVFAGNVIGVAAAAAITTFAKLQSPEMLDSMVTVSSKLLEKDWHQVLLQGIPAGFLISSIAWIRSAADDNSFWIVLALTYAIAIGGFTHVVAGSAEAFLLLANGKASLLWVLTGFLIPALVGNIIGGTGLFAMLAHAQVKGEI